MLACEVEGVAPATSGHLLVSAMTEIHSKHISSSYSYCSVTELKVILTSSHMTRRQTLLLKFMQIEKSLFFIASFFVLVRSDFAVFLLAVSASFRAPGRSPLRNRGVPPGLMLSFPHTYMCCVTVAAR